MLDSLHIKNFRSLTDFQVEKLGRINLIVGKNNSGKSSVLEALRIYAGNGQRVLLEAIAAEHDEKYSTEEAEGMEQDATLPFQDFFTGRQFPNDDETVIHIGRTPGLTDVLLMKHVFMTETTQPVDEGSRSLFVQYQEVLKSDAASTTDDIMQALRISQGERKLPLYFLDAVPGRFKTPKFDFSNAIPCSVVPTQFVSQDELADEWDKIALSDDAEFVKQAMRIIAPEFDALAFVRNDTVNSTSPRRIQRSGKVRLSNALKPVPLKSLGDGVMRVLQLTLKLLSAKGGFLLIDEFENGLHYSVQEKVWTMLFEMAEKLDVQVFATTHSWDCIESFTQVARAHADIEGVLFRMGKSVRTSDKGKVIATVFEEEALYAITQSEMEVR